MAGDRGLAFVVIGLIGVSALFISNHGRIDPARPRAHTAGIVSEPISYSPEILSATGQGTAAPVGSFDTANPASYILRMQDTIAPKNAVTGIYPELTGSAAGPLSRIRQRLRLFKDSGLTPPLN